MNTKTLTLCALIYISNVYGLNLKEVLESTRRHYPTIYEAKLRVKASEMEVRAAKGQFDSRLSTTFSHRPSGYYDGRDIDISIKRPLPFANSEVYLGARRSDGLFPDYQGDRDTLNRGELRIGGKMSLWRGLFIDKKRFKVTKKQAYLEQGNQGVRLSLMHSLSEASTVYWQWAAAKNIYNIYKNLLQTAKSRQNGLKKRVKQGDLAKIYLTENQQYILKREALVTKAENYLRSTELKLSMFLRDEKDNLKLKEIRRSTPQKFEFLELEQKALNLDRSRLISNLPQLRILDSKIQLTNQEERLAENELMPAIDLKFETSRDFGKGSKTLKQHENKVMLTFELPLERDLGKGKTREARFKRRSLTLKKSLYQQKLHIKFRNLLNTIQASKSVVLLTKREELLAKKLESAEIKRFNQGDSDFFLINIREQNTADIQVKKIKSFLDYKKNLVKFNFISGNPLNL